MSAAGQRKRTPAKRVRAKAVVDAKPFLSEEWLRYFSAHAAEPRAAHVDTPAAAPPVPAASERALTAAQYRILLEEFASRANMLRESLQRAADRASSADDAQDFYLGSFVAESIGALADHFIGGLCVGDIVQWQMPQRFHDAGQEGGAQ